VNASNSIGWNWTNLHGEEQTGRPVYRKFDILASYVYARGLIDGSNDDEANQRGLVAGSGRCGFSLVGKAVPKSTWLCLPELQRGRGELAFGGGWLERRTLRQLRLRLRT
jgi:hypothetical protein